MTDQIDEAQRLEMHAQQRALTNQLTKARETQAPREIDGDRYCLGCGDSIPAERLAARPESVHCVDCKQLKEQQEKHYA